MQSLSCIFFSALLFISCNTSGDRKASTTSLPANTPVFQQQADSTVSIPSVSPANGVVLNPPHGAPGHSCEVLEGAPLPTAAKPTVTAPQSPAPVAQPSPMVLPNTAKGVKLNPAHGEPGHDCAVNVGSPLPQ